MAASVGLLTLGTVSSTHGQLVTLLPSGPLSQAPLQEFGPASHSGTLPQAAHSLAPQSPVVSAPLFTHRHLHTGGPQIKHNETHFYLIAAPYV